MQNHFLTVTILLTLGAACAADLPQHPRLLLNQAGVAQLKQRIESCDWAKSSWQSLKKRADELLKKKVEIPPRGGNWTHWYACPTHGTSLSRGKQLGTWQWEHTCSVDNEVFKGDPNDPSHDYDGCAISLIHREWSRGVRDLGIVYQVTGDRRYARKARAILLAYAAAYASYPLHNTQGKPVVGGGRIGSQTLDESTWLIPVCQGMDLVWDTLSDDDRSTIADKLLLPSAKGVIMPYKLRIHNIQCWKNSAVGLVGFLLGDQDLISAAIEDPERGYRAQMAKGVNADGEWWEGAWGYHFYTMSALWPLTEAARNCGLDLYGREFRRLFDAPHKFAMPNLHLPAFSDSAEIDLTLSRGIYELAYTRYHNPDCLNLLSRGPRDSDYALLYGESLPPAAPVKEHKSANYPASGYAILTRGTGEHATWLCLKYGAYGSSHGHPDKLSFVLYARDRTIAVDPGSVAYGLPIEEGWFKTSIAHNTLVVDETSQKAVGGKLIAFGSEKDADYVVADAGPIYAGVRFVRTIALLDPKLVVIVDQVKSDKPAVLDIAYHQQGSWVDPIAGDPWSPPDKPGYRYLKDATVRELAGPVNLATRIEADWRAAITIDAGNGAQLITATGVTSHTQERVPCAIVRRTGTQSTVIWALALDAKPAHIERLATTAKGADGLPPVAFRVTSCDGRTWTLTGGVSSPIAR